MAKKSLPQPEKDFGLIIDILTQQRDIQCRGVLQNQADFTYQTEMLKRANAEIESLKTKLAEAEKTSG